MAEFLSTLTKYKVSGNDEDELKKFETLANHILE